jgi:hypothetical protein
MGDNMTPKDSLLSGKKMVSISEKVEKYST